MLTRANAAHADRGISLWEAPRRKISTECVQPYAPRPETVSFNGQAAGAQLLAGGPIPRLHASQSHSGYAERHKVLRNGVKPRSERGDAESIHFRKKTVWALTRNRCHRGLRRIGIYVTTTAESPVHCFSV